MSPGLHPETKEVLTPVDLQEIFADELIAQEVSTERFIEIPKEVREEYKKWRPSPLFRARSLEKPWIHPAVFIISTKDLVR